MYALRISNFINGTATGKPDGMFIRKDGLLTDHKQNALLFETENQAIDYGVNWKKTTATSLVGVKYSGPLFVVQGTVKHVLHVVDGVKCHL